MSDLTIGAKPIRQPDEQSFAAALRITLAIFILATPFFLYMGLSAAQVQEEYRLSRLVEGRRQLTKEHERLLLTRDALLSPGAVNAIARDKLGMVEENAQEWTVGVAPEKKDGGVGRAGDGGKKEKSNDPANRKAGENPHAKKPADKGRGGDAASKVADKAAADSKAEEAPLKEAAAGKSASSPAMAKTSSNAFASGRVTDAVARPMPVGGPEKVSARHPASSASASKAANTKKAGAKAKGRKTR